MRWLSNHQTYRALQLFAVLGAGESLFRLVKFHSSSTWIIMLIAYAIAIMAYRICVDHGDPVERIPVHYPCGCSGRHQLMDLGQGVRHYMVQHEHYCLTHQEMQHFTEQC
jgi:hypothetical protein